MTRRGGPKRWQGEPQLGVCSNPPGLVAETSSPSRSDEGHLGGWSSSFFRGSSLPARLLDVAGPAIVEEGVDEDAHLTLPARAERQQQLFVVPGIERSIYLVAGRR